MPGKAADYAIGPEVDAGSGPGGEVAPDVAIARGDSAEDIRVAGHVPLISNVAAAVRPNSTVVTIDTDVIAIKINVVFYDHGFHEQGIFAGGDSHGARNISHSGSRHGCGQKNVCPGGR